MNINYDKIRKDTNVKDTIKYISKILKNNKIKIKKSKIFRINNNFFSTRIELKDFYDLGTNGKGLTKYAAMASAYAELMERIETGFLINNSFLSKEKHKTNFIDEKKVDYNNIINSNISVFFENDNYKNFIKNNNDYYIMSSFTNIKNNKQINLPIKLINTTTHTNGLCAGNSIEEALCQGTCEILERYCYNKILKNELKLKNVIIDDKLFISSKIKNIEKLGYKVEIKDCSISKFPVIGVLITNKDKSKYLFTMASDPNINIAIQRCITELFQGLNSKKMIDKKMKKIDNNYDFMNDEEKELNWFKCYNSNNGIHPWKLFKNKEKIYYDKLPFNNNINNNKDAYTFITNLILNNNYNFFYKEYSMLNFKAYRVYIPGLSEIDRIKDYEYEFLLNKEKIENIIFDINNKSYEEIEYCMSILNKIMYKSKYKMMDLGTIFHCKHYIKTNFNKLSLEMIYILLGKKINKKIELNSSTISDYFLNNSFNDIINSYNIVLPTCPNCSNCPLKNNCKYTQWKKMIKTLQK